MRDIGNVIFVAGAILYFSAYIWAFVIASRVSVSWFFGMVFLGWLLYPFFAYKNWEICKNNCMMMYGGVALCIIAFFILWATNLNKIPI